MSQSAIVLRWPWWWEGSLVSCCWCFARWLWLTCRRYPDLLWGHLLPVPIHRFIQVNNTSPFYFTFNLPYPLFNPYSADVENMVSF